jgi:hypothetical protein
MGSMANAQKIPKEIYKPLIVKLDSSGEHYLRFIIWNQIWLSSNNLAENDASLQMSMSIRRSRLITYAQLSPRFMVLSHFGLNSLTPGNLTSLGNNGDAAQIFLHGAWAEVKLNKQFYIGGGLHYWNGLTRLASQSTVSFAGLDQSRPFTAYHSLGITDQFARHLGVYVKGNAGKFHYRISWNNPGNKPLNDGLDYSSLFNESGEPVSSMSYTGVLNKNKDGKPTGNNIYTAYFKYDLWEEEASKLPYFSGNYLGTKRILALGGGFFLHPNGMYNTTTQAHTDVRHFALDLFIDQPLTTGSIQGYLSIQNFDYGENYISRWAGTGQSYFGQLAYYLKSLKSMPYIAYSHSIFEGAEKPIRSLDVGINYFISGHNCKLTFEYHTIMDDYREAGLSFDGTTDWRQIRIQFQVFL